MRASLSMSWCDGWWRTPRPTADAVEARRQRKTWRARSARPTRCRALERICRVGSPVTPAGASAAGARGSCGSAWRWYRRLRLLLAATLGYGVITGGHATDVVDWLKDARDETANALGFGIAAISLTGPKEVSREDILTTAGVTGRASLLFLDADAARARLMANPWIADAAVLKLYPDRLQITSPSGRPSRSGRKTAVLASLPPTAPCSSRLSKTAIAACRSWSGGAERKPRISSPSSTAIRYPWTRARVDLGRGAALESAAQQRHRRRLPENNVEPALTGWCARPRQKAAVTRHRRGRSAITRSGHRAALGCGGAGS